MLSSAAPSISRRARSGADSASGNASVCKPECNDSNARYTSPLEIATIANPAGSASSAIAASSSRRPETSTTASGPNAASSARTVASSSRSTWRCSAAASPAGSVTPRWHNRTVSPRATNAEPIARPMNFVPPKITTRIGPPLGTEPATASGFANGVLELDAGVAGVLVDRGKLGVAELEPVQCTDVVLQLFHAAGPDQHARHPLIAQRPGQRELGQRLTTGRGHVVQDP